MANHLIEVSVLGGGNAYGESVVLTDGLGSWFVVDSFLESGVPAPLKYLKSIGVDVSSQVKGVIATHWHNDHIRGLDEILKECEKAQFYASSAYKAEEFMTLIQCDEEIASKDKDKSLTTFANIYSILRQRKQPMCGAEINKSLWGNQNAELIALSPSDQTIAEARMQLRKYIEDQSSSNGRIPRHAPNDMSVVLLFRVNKKIILLGADLEVSSDSRKGWCAVCASHKCPNDIQLFKISHHGSQNGYFEDFWLKNLKKEFLSATTPFGLHNLPTEKDVERILAHSPNSFITGAPKPSRRLRYDRPVEKSLETHGKKIFDKSIDYGQIRFACDASDANSEWQVQLFGQAMNISDLTSKSA